MSQLKVALLQMIGDSDVQANTEKATQYCREAKQQNADIILFPELWNIGYTAPPQDAAGFAQWQVAATDSRGSYLQHFIKLAKTMEVAIVATYLEGADNKLFNAATLIDRFGTIQCTYRKVHTVDALWEAVLTPGEQYFVSDLDTAQGKVKIGIMTCYDREFPEVARILMLKGAEIILVPNACEIEENRIAQFRTRAFENMVGVAMANYASPQQNGHSIAFDGMRVKGSYHDPLLVEAEGKEGVYIATFDLTVLREYREREIWGNAYRKVKTYHQLLNEEVEQPFTRKDARR